MNFVAGCLLLFLDEEDAFWALARIIEDLLPGYFSTAMVEPQARAHAQPPLQGPAGAPAVLACRFPHGGSMPRHGVRRGTGWEVQYVAVQRTPGWC
jgi:hypothetical protein